MTTDKFDRDLCIHYPTAPRVFLMRAAWVEFAVAAVQIVHLSLFASGNLLDYITWAVVHIIAQLSLFILRRSACANSSFSYIPWKPLATLLLLTFLAKLYSRFPYIASWLADGLRTVRTSEELGAGSYLSAINILFYPLSILLAVTTLPKRVYFRLMLCVILMCIVDLIFLGKGGAPWFVLLFHFLSYPVQQIKKAHIIFVLLLFIAMIVFFNYSIVYRTEEGGAGAFDWLVIFEFTGSTQILKINTDVAQWLAANMPVFLPIIFLFHYLTHSIAELANLVNNSDALRLGHAYYLVDQLCGVGLCSRNDSSLAIEMANPRSGIYQTAWGSLIYDFGFGGAVFVWILLVSLITFFQSLRHYKVGPSVFVAAVIITLSPIENFLYNGLGLVQVLVLFLMYFFVRLLGRV